MKEQTFFVITNKMVIQLIVWVAVILTLVWVFTGCKKEEEQPITIKYDGTWEYSTPFFSQTEKYAYRAISSVDGQLYISTNWGNGVQTAYSLMNGYEYNAFEILADNSCEMQFVTITGKGTFVGDSLYEQGELTFTTNNHSYKGEWHSKLLKRH